MDYSLLVPISSSKPGKLDVLINPNLDVLDLVPAGEIVSVDIETCGTQAADPACYVVGVGIAWSGGIYYFSLPDLDRPELLAKFLLRQDMELVGHNVFFDSAFLTRELGPGMKWTYDTYGLFRQLASEGWIGQRYGLKDAQLDLLGWDEKGDEELNEWLVQAGYVKNPDVYTSEKYTPSLRLALYQEGKCRPEKGQMYLAPKEILGYYCGLDAYSTLILLTDIFIPTILRLPEAAQDVFSHYHQTYMNNVSLLVEQQLAGILIDVDKLDKTKQDLLLRGEDTYTKFLTHPDSAPAISEWNARVVSELVEKEPEQYKKKPELGKEPSKLTKKGETSGAWMKWDEKRRKIEALGPGETSKNWLSWKIRLEEASNTQHFNISSGPQRQWLFYEKLKFPVRVTTKSDKPATDKKALPGFGEPGKLLNNFDKISKLATFIDSLRDKLLPGADGQPRLNPQFKVPGTFTGRLGGSGKFNLQNIPKNADFASAFLAPTGRVWVDLDFASLEQYVLAELSRDPALLKLYGPGAKVNDVYLFVGSNLPGIGPKIRAAGYDPDFPTQEGIDAAKKACKKERQVSKVITLASSYGAGALKIQDTLQLEGIHLSIPEAKQLHAGYWKLFAGVKQYGSYLEDEWERRGGWVYNGIGRPVCCYVDKKKDIVNRVVQSTGHDILMMYIQILHQLILRDNIPATPVFLDTHDATTWEVEEKYGLHLKSLFEEAMSTLNEQLLLGGGVVKLAGEAVIVRNLAEAKGLT